MLRITIPLLAGVLVAFQFSPVAFIYLYVGIVGFLVSALLLGGKLTYTRRWIWGVLIGAAIFLIGAIRVLSSIEKPCYTQGYTGLFQVMLLDAPEERTNSFRVEAMLISEVLHDSIYPQKVKILLYLKKNDSLGSSLKPNDLLLAKLRLQLPPIAATPGDFDFRQYLANRGIYYCSYPAKEDVVFLGMVTKISPLLYFRRLRASIIQRLPSLGIEDKNLAVFSALTLGYKGLLDPDTRNDFVAAGAMHVLAVSGLHVGIVYLVVAFMVGLHDKQKRFVKQRAILVIILLWLYAFITGLPPSVFRATVMFCFVVGAKVVRRQVNIYNSIAASAFVLILIQPKIVYDIGFVLSYLAVISIVYFQPKIYGWISPQGWLLQKVWALTSVSIAAQIATTPVSVAVFGQFPTYFWLSNIVVILLATIILYLSVPFAIIASVWSSAGWCVGKLLSFFLIAMRWSTDFVEHMPGSLIQGLTLSLWQTGTIIFAIMSLAFYVEMRKKLALLICLGSVAFTIVFFGWIAIKHKQQEFVAVMSVRSSLVVALVEGESATLIINADSLDVYTVAKQLSNFQTHFHIREMKILAASQVSSNLFQYRVNHAFIADSSLLALGFGGKRILIQLRGRITRKAKVSNNSRLHADIVVASTVYDAVALNYFVDSRIFVVNNYLPRRMKNVSLVRDFWIIPVQGAYCLSIKG